MPRVGLARGKSAGRASPRSSLAHWGQGAGRRVSGGLPPGAGAVCVYGGVGVVAGC